MDGAKTLEFIQVISQPLSVRLFWNIKHRDINQYQSEVDAKEIAFEMTLSERLNTDDSHKKQLPEIKDRLKSILKRIQNRRCRYELAIKELSNEFSTPTSSKHPLLRVKPTKQEMHHRDKIQHLRNIVVQFKSILEPNIKKAIRYIEKKEKEYNVENPITVVVVEKSSRNVTKNENTETDSKPYYRDVKYAKKHLGEIYKRAVREHILEDTCLADFVYYFSGEGKQATNKLKKDKGAPLTDLAIFIKDLMLFPDTKNVWVITENVFIDIKRNSIKSAYARLNQFEDDFTKAYNRIMRIIQDIYDKEQELAQ